MHYIRTCIVTYTTYVHCSGMGMHGFLTHAIIHYCDSVYWLFSAMMTFMVLFIKVYDGHSLIVSLTYILAIIHSNMCSFGILKICTLCWFSYFYYVSVHVKLALDLKFYSYVHLLTKLIEYIAT